MIFTRDNLVETLRHNIVTVSFTKINGEQRVMRCTLISDHIPNAPKANGSIITETTNKETISVWDLTANGWRSFRVDSVKSVTIGL